MITIDLTGNIGDQITRYLLCRSVAEKNGYEWGINKRTSHDYYNGAEQMSFFDIDYGLSNNTSYGELPPGITNIWTEKHNHYNTHDYHSYQPDIFDIEDNTKLVVRCGHDARYYNQNRVKEWLKIKEHLQLQYHYKLLAHGIDLEDDDTCVINCRGGEYRTVPSLFLEKSYWDNAISHMLDRNPSMKFVVITEDSTYFKNIFACPVHHFSIGNDFYAVQHAKNLILSNSAFGIFSTWTNSNDPYVIAPKYWSRHNISDGYWGNSDMATFGWNFMDRDGVIDG